MMRSPVGDVRWDYAINAVLFVVLRGRAEGGPRWLLTFCRHGRWHTVAPRSGKAQFHRLLEKLYAVEGSGTPPWSCGASSVARQHKRGSCSYSPI